MSVNTVGHPKMANAIRFLSADAVQKAKSGHPGMPMGMADAATVLFTRFMKFDSAEPLWADRDRFVLSAGHGSMLLYSLGYLLGYEDVTLDQLKNFRQLGSATAGHPEFGHVSNAETTTGPLGQGITNAVGMALAEKMLEARYGADIVDHYTYAIAGDGCLMEGISQEAISMAGHWGLCKLIVLWDDNEISIDGRVGLATSDNQIMRFEASGWDTQSVDGHDPEALAAAIEKARASDKPSLIACKTVIGYGAPRLAGSEKTHGAPLGEEELAGMREKLGWNEPPFEIPQDILDAWRAAGARGADARAAWQKRFDAADPATKQTFLDGVAGRLPQGWDKGLDELKRTAAEEKPKVATRKASQMSLEKIVPALPQIVGGSADLTHSNLTITKDMKSVTPIDFSGNYMHYGVREHGMGAVMNGLALHGGFIPYGGTFLVFTDYCRPAIRMGAIMGQRVIYVMTHDSIGLGEDGPTHQPVEHLASLRAMPNVLVMRPADVIETAECWQLALENDKGPSVLALSRQNLPTVRGYSAENISAKGAYVLAEAEGGARDATILATGSEIEIALAACAALAEKGVRAAVVSMPCWELFERQSAAYKASVLGHAPRVAVEALSTFGWERYVGDDSAIVGMRSFGASGPADQLYKHFGITAEAVVDAVTAQIKKSA
jgi:transketolase